jgi:sugar lactone lactonase YvrE
MIRSVRLYTLLVVAAATALAGCAVADSGSAAARGQAAEALPHWSFSPEMIFPADRSLLRPEDGVVLPDGRLIVADQAHGLRLVLADGTHRPFGRFSGAGYFHEPPRAPGGANGVALEPGGTHILVADVHHGGIYRVDIASEETELLYQHGFGVNMARPDGRGGVWFTQSTRNPRESGEAGIWAALETPTPDGAVYYLPPARAGETSAAVRVADGLFFANGIALDERAGYLYVAETMGGRVLRFRMDVAGGLLSERTIALELPAPDNIEFDPPSRLWIAVPLRSEIIVLDLDSGVAQSVFRVATPRSEELLREVELRIERGEHFLDLFGPDLWEPAPGALTGMILSPGGGPVYVTGLGNALMHLER